MNLSACLKQIGRGERGARDLGTDEAATLFGAMLDGGVPDLELGAILLALRLKTESLSELLGFHAALGARLAQLRAPVPGIRTVVIPSYNGARRQPNLMPLLVLLLRRIGVPVLVHGVLESDGRVAAAYVFREFGLFPCASLRHAQEALQRDGMAFVPIGALAPGLSNLLALRSRLGLRSCAHTMAKLIDPFSADGGGLRMISVTHPAYADKLREFLSQSDGAALLMRGTEGEAYANPRRRPQIEAFVDGAAEVLFPAEQGTGRSAPAAAEPADARATAAWIRAALDGDQPIPAAIISQLAGCLYACGYCSSLSEAKAVATVRSRQPLAA
ncbi:MAG: DNA-binding protein YbiB [Burkholderiales bacterium]|nr:DNA-binding protein YbiB [Burkholderiales bacterium]